MKKLINKLKCMLYGHVRFDCGEPIRFMQPKAVGNKTMTVIICERCGVMSVEAGTLSKEELEAEQIIEAKHKQLQLEMEQLQEKTIKKLTELQIERNGKAALN